MKATYTYDPSGNVTSIDDAPQGKPADTQCFRYDHLRRLTEAWTPAGTCTADPAVATLGGPAAYWSSLAYDTAGNRKTETRHASSGDVTRTLVYPAATQPHPHAPDSLRTTGPGGEQLDFTHDAAGNTLTRGSAQTLEWDAEGRLSKLTKETATTAFLYDADGNRLLRRDPAGTTLYLGDVEFRARSGGGPVETTRYYRQGDALAVRTPDNKLTFLIQDLRGTPLIAVDAATSSAVQRRFTPFGEVRGTAPASWPGELGYLGGIAVPSTGLIHLTGGQYDPVTGTFLAPDTTSPATADPYTLATHTPVR